MLLEDDTDEMDMPTPCQHCGEWFDLNNGTGSKKWFPETVICDSCGEEEALEIEKDEEIQDLQNNISDAEITIVDANARLVELGVRKVVDGLKKVGNICFDILEITDNEFKAVEEMAAGQIAYLNPLKMATSIRQSKLGEHNLKVLEGLKTLKQIIIEGESLHVDR